MSVNKAMRLMKQAKVDLENGCYDKAVSAAYFSVRMLSETYLKGLRTRRDDKIANALGKKLGDQVRLEYLYLFERRKEADHRDKVFGKEEARRIVARAESLFNRLISLLGEE